MTFGPGHYVPVLKVKRGEKRALHELDARVREALTPLLEIVERNAEKKSGATVKSHLDYAFRDLDQAVRHCSRYFLDAREIGSDGPTAAVAVFERTTEISTPFTPVTGISRTADVGAALKQRAQGIAVRLTRQEFEAGNIAARLNKFMVSTGLASGEVDLIVDLGSVESMVTEGVVAFSGAFLTAVPDPTGWRSLTVSGCAFPKSMQRVGRHGHELVERVEWLAWKAMHAARGTLVRLPTFSDCAVQHTEGVEGIDFRKVPVSASIRYTRPDDWLLIKGESTRNVSPSEQFPRLAKKLVRGDLSQHYANAAHCAGCNSMKDAANGAPNYGSAEAWRRLGTIHHLTVAVEELAKLPWP